MKCKRCETQFSPQSAMVTDHKYVQECIDALKGRVRELERVPDAKYSQEEAVTAIAQLITPGKAVFYTTTRGQITDYFVSTV